MVNGLQELRGIGTGSHRDRGFHWIGGFLGTAYSGPTLAVGSCPSRRIAVPASSAGQLQLREVRSLFALHDSIGSTVGLEGIEHRHEVRALGDRNPPAPRR